MFLKTFKNKAHEQFRMIKVLRKFPEHGTFGHHEDVLHRPPTFSLLFWSILAAACVDAFLWFIPDDLRFGEVPVAVAVVALAAVWMELPWNSQADPRRKLLAPIFICLIILFGVLLDPIWSVALCSVAFANGVFLLGFRWGAVYAAFILAVVLLVLQFLYSEELGFWRATYVTGFLMIPIAAFVFGVCSVELKAARGREESRVLLRSLREANSDLESYAVKVRELTLSEERARIAREMHDSLGHHLTVIHLQLQNAVRLEDRKPEKSREQVRNASRLTLEALTEVQRSVRALKPLALKETSGIGALAALARSFGGTGLEVRFEAVGQPRELTTEAELTLYRALQEGITNALRHSVARSVTATLTFDHESVELVVADDGKGAVEVDLENDSLNGGFGLPGLKKRIEALEGVFRAANAEDGGFELRIELPTGSDHSIGAGF